MASTQAHTNYRMMFSRSCSILSLLLLLAPSGNAYVPVVSSQRAFVARATATRPVVSRHRCPLRQSSSGSDDDKEYTNPYQDPNYPDLEFVDYSKPEYQVDQGDEFSTQSTKQSTEDEVETMREERRLRNDEFQFQTYFQRTCQEGVDHLGDWTIYKTSTFMEDGTEGIPRMIQARRPMQVTSRVMKMGAESLVDERIVHEEILHEDLMLDDEDPQDDDKDFCSKSYYQTYWPEELAPFDFRGHQGIMVCGNAWTICTAESHSGEEHSGPFSEYQAELGIQYESMRMRVKMDYSTLPGQQANTSPPLYLKYLTVCREVVAPEDGTWPRKTKDTAVSEALFGVPGADNGLYDPPPVSMASQYITLDLPGHATVLLPYKMDQHEDERISGWVTSLDWTPGPMRYQVDRKIQSGTGLLGLRSLELSEVQSKNAETYRPRDGGKNMSQ
jgi:hypothetical protein